MRWSLLALLLLASSMLTPGVAAQPDVRLTLEVDDRGNCARGAAMCYSLTGGSFALVRPGSIVELTFRNTGRVAHDVHVAELTERTRAHAATEQGEVHAATQPGLAPGSEETIVFTVPPQWDGLYLWCSVAGHEESGLWIEVPLARAGNDAPLGVWAALMALLGAAVTWRGERRGQGR